MIVWTDRIGSSGHGGREVEESLEFGGVYLHGGGV